MGKNAKPRKKIILLKKIKNYTDKILKKLLSILFIIYLPFNSFAQQLPDDGLMKCTVKSQVILAIKDGASTQYSGKRNGVNVGDILLFRYEANDEGELLVKLSNDKNTVFFWYYEPDRESSYYSDSEASGRYKTFNNSGHHSFNLWDWKMMFKTHDGHQQLYLSKNNNKAWDGMFTEVDHKNTFVLALDCRQKRPRIKEIIEYFWNYSKDL